MNFQLGATMSAESPCAVSLVLQMEKAGGDPARPLLPRNPHTSLDTPATPAPNPKP